MLRTNLATRPFYNERLAAILVWGITAIVIALTVASLVRLSALSGRDADLRREATASEQRAAELRRQAQQARARVDPAHVKKVAAAAREANALIEGRTFSWTELFNRYEATLPAGVRIVSVRPAAAGDGQFTVSMTVMAREVGEIDAFMEALEAHGGFRDVLARTEHIDEEGRIEAMLTGRYLGAIPDAQHAARNADGGAR